MATEKKKACKECGYLTIEKECPSCGSKSFLEKHKGKVVIFNSKSSIVSEKLNIKNNGMYALKYG